FSADLLWELSWVEFWGERWALAAEHAARSRELSLQYGVERNQDYIPSSWVAVHRGDLDLARREATRALKLCEEQIGFYPPLLQAVSDSFGRARALLALGVVRRRERQKLAARDAISAALAGFEELGAAGWAERARQELGRIGGRTREDGLTAAERRVAALVVEGRTNQEVAAALFVAERTVANHLTHIYAKLGVRSRTQLARKVGNF